jgi:hypothetical protein
MIVNILAAGTRGGAAEIIERAYLNYSAAS